MKILFISHEATLTGAPILLLRLIEQVKKHSALEILILVKEGGELEKRFEALGKTLVWDRAIPDNFNHRWKNRIYRKIGLRTSTQQQLYKEAILKEVGQADIVFNNTIANTALLKELPLQGKKIFSYIHELAIVTELLASSEDIAYLGSISQKIFVPTLAVKDLFCNKYHLPETRIALLKSIIPQQDGKEITGSKIVNRPGGAQFLVGFCGTLDWRKGFELLPLLARKIVQEKNVTDIHFVWIGVNKTSRNYLILHNDLLKLKLDSYFTFIPNEPGIQHYLAQLDVFVLPSREDPFPLVVLEAACYGVPCIYFRDAGGIAEFCGDDAGIAIDYLDIDGMADAIIKLKLDQPARDALGNCAKEKVAGYSDESFNIRELLEYFNAS
ncbi:MAG: glycosyltransferase family 4 protein [Ferruginibacter sp.]